MRNRKCFKSDRGTKLSNAINGLGHGDDEEYCQTLGGVSIKSDERQSENKNHLSYSTGSKIFPQTNERNITQMASQKTNQKNCQRVK